MRRPPSDTGRREPRRPGPARSRAFGTPCRTATIDDGAGAGDVRIEKQEWHLTQSGSAIRGYYIAALTFVSGDGRPYVCSRQPQFSTLQRFEVAGRVRDGAIEIQEIGLAGAAAQNRCDPGRGSSRVTAACWTVTC